MAVIAILNFTKARITDEEKQEIVRAHNYYRGKVDPLATNMEQMVSFLLERFDLLHLLVYLGVGR